MICVATDDAATLDGTLEGATLEATMEETALDDDAAFAK